MAFNIDPSNFLLFLFIFTVSWAIGVYLFVSYKRTLLNYINSAMFVMVGITATVEYYVQQLEFEDDWFEVVDSTIGPSIHGFMLLCWTLMYLYANPFEKTNFKKKIDFMVITFIILIPGVITMYLLSTANIFITNTERINGLWTFMPNKSLIYDVYIVYTFLIMGFIYSFAIYFYSLKKFPHDRMKKIFLILIFFIAFFLLDISNESFVGLEWKVSAYAINMLLLASSMTWFVSEYRGLQNGYKMAILDLLNSISDLGIQTDLSFNILHYNNKAKGILGTPKNNLFNFLKPLIHSGTKVQLEETIDQLVAGEINHCEILMTSIQGNSITVQVKASEFSWRGKKHGYTFLMTDLTELKNTERKLREANETKDQLFSMIAHDLRKPALAFKGVTNKVNYLIQKKEFDLLNNLGNSIEKSAIQLNTLLNNLLKWALTQKDAIKVIEQPVSIKRLTDELIKTFDLITSEKGVELDNKGVDPELIIQTDPDILNTIVRNLVDNAIKYSEKDSTVLISTSSVGGRTNILIKDNGIGMTSEQVNNLFSLGKGKSKSGTMGEKGSGLGLNLVKSLVNETGGEIECYSTLNQGTEMMVNYPS